MNTRSVVTPKTLAGQRDIGGARLAFSAGLNIELNLLSFLQIADTGLAKIPDMAKYVGATAGRRNEPEPAIDIEELNRAATL